MMLLAATASVETLWLVFNLGLTLVALLISAGFSGSEAALFSLTPAQIDHNNSSPNRYRRFAAALMRRPKRTLMHILVGNTATNTFLFANSYLIVDDLAGHWHTPWLTPIGGIATILMLIVFGDLIPKTVALSVPDRFAPFAGAFLHYLGYLIAPISSLIDWVLVRPFERLFFAEYGHGTSANPRLSTTELKALLELSRRRRIINRVEDQFLREVIDLHYLRVRDVMIPRVQLVAYDVNKPAEGLRALIRETKLKKIPVYDGAIDNFVGLVYAKMLFLAPANRPLRDLAMPVRFVPEMIQCEQLLQHFKLTKTQIAIVVDEYGGVAGLVTLEDILEAIVGDLADPYEPLTEPEVQEVSENEYDIDGQLSIHYWSDLFGLPRFTERIATVGGLVTSELGRPAIVGDVVRFKNVALTVTRVHGRRVARLRAKLLQTQEAGA